MNKFAAYLIDLHKSIYWFNTYEEAVAAAKAVSKNFNVTSRIAHIYRGAVDNYKLLNGEWIIEYR